jgi:hypothetical protein
VGETKENRYSGNAISCLGARGEIDKHQQGSAAMGKRVLAVRMFYVCNLTLEPPESGPHAHPTTAIAIRDIHFVKRTNNARRKQVEPHHISCVLFSHLMMLPVAMAAVHHGGRKWHAHALPRCANQSRAQFQAITYTLSSHRAHWIGTAIVRQTSP